MESKFKIPTKFQVGSSNYKVVIKPVINSFKSDGDIFGYQDPIKEEIALALTHTSRIVPEKEIYKTFYHELVHAILDEMGERELSDNERFVDGFSRLLVQYGLSKKFTK